MRHFSEKRLALERQELTSEGMQSSHVTQLYLRVALTVLQTSAAPLSAREIVERGIERGLFGDHSFGHTPEKSMQARLSLDIKEKTTNSLFMRVARGRFVLRNTQGALSEPAEYVAEPRQLRLPTESVLCVSEDHYAELLNFQGIGTETKSLLPALTTRALYRSREEAENKNDAKQFVTYVLVQCGHRLLSFRRSYISRAAEFLRGARCVGFGGHVTEADNDLFSPLDLGLDNCARRELGEELTVQRDNASGQSVENIRVSGAVDLFRLAPIECLGILNDDSSEVGRRHVAIVYRLWLDDWQIARSIEKAEASLRSLSWLDLTAKKIDITDFEYWSQICLRTFYPASVAFNPVVRHSSVRQTQRARTLVVSGRIGSGKSEICSYLAAKWGAEVIGSGVVLQKLMSSPTLEEIGRADFQQRAESFICSYGGPQKLAGEIAHQIGKSTAARIIVDGIRQLETFESLAKILSERPALVYVHTPPDIAYKMYQSREGGGPLNSSHREFLRLYDAPVESDLASLGRTAQTYIYNYLGLESLRLALDKFADELS
jgi:predicted NUDIX family phosphoesterase